MKVVFTQDALRDLDEILQYISTNYPGVYGPFEKRLRTIVTRIGTWPGSAQEVVQRPNIRSVPFIRYPYKIFYRVLSDRVEVLHLHHSARDDDGRARFHRPPRRSRGAGRRVARTHVKSVSRAKPS